MIRMSRLLKESAVKAYRAREELEKKYGREPTMEEVADETGISREELVMAMEAAADVESFSQTVYSGDGSPVLLQDRVPDRQDRNEELLNRMLLSQLLDLLEDSEKEIIRLRYFEDMTQNQIAQQLGMTQVQVSRAEKRILKKLRKGAPGKKYHYFRFSFFSLNAFRYWLGVIPSIFLKIRRKYFSSRNPHIYAILLVVIFGGGAVSRFLAALILYSVM